MKIANRIVMTFAGLLLAVAAVLKFFEVLDLCIPSWNENGIWESYEFFLIQIPLEFALGVWMLSGLFRKAAWLAGTLAYFGFIFVTLAKALGGLESCGCFGQIHVNPWITLFAIDVPFFLLLAIFRPKGEKLLPPPWPNTFHAIAVAVPIFAAMIFAVPVLVAFRPECEKVDNNWQKVELPPMLKKAIEAIPPEPKPLEDPQPKTDPVEVKPDEPVQVVEPDPVEPKPVETAVQELPEVPQWPWLEHIDIADQINTGITVILMYHHDCPTCMDMVPKYNEYCQQLQQAGDDSINIAFVAIPPYGKPGETPLPENPACISGKLSDQKKWSIMSPYTVALIDGGFARDWPQGTTPEPENLLNEIFEVEE